MPELPEVETIVRGLKRRLKNRQIIDLWTDWPKYFKLPGGEAAFRSHIIGKKITGVFRRGKNVLIHLNDGHLLLIHQKISGHLLLGKWRKTAPGTVKSKWENEQWLPAAPKNSPLWDPMNRFLRLIFFLDTKEMLALSDLRRFAKVLCGPKEVILNLPDLKNLGPEPLDKSFTFQKFRELFSGKRGRIKQVLLDQSFIAGIGNIYSDEILWLSKIHPLARVEDLNKKELRRIYDSIKKVLKKALRLKGTSIDDYRDAEGKKGKYDLVRYVYQREGEACPRCGTKIKRLKLGGRSAHYCPQCQKL